MFALLVTYADQGNFFACLGSCGFLRRPQKQVFFAAFLSISVEPSHKCLNGIFHDVVS